MSKLNYGVCAITMALSGTVPAHRFVGTDKALAGAAANTLGVSQNEGTDEDTAVDTLGVVPVETGAAVTEGGLVEADASGRAINKTAGVAVARALEGSTAAGEFVLCQLIPN